MATPTEKSNGLESALTSMFGFDRRDAINSNRCVPAPVGCGGPAETFRNPGSEREYKISGLCQACQDNFFGGPEYDE